MLNGLFVKTSEDKQEDNTKRKKHHTHENIGYARFVHRAWHKQPRDKFML